VRSFAVSDVIAWEPCKGYTEERIRALWGDRESLTALDILDLRIPAEDRLWAVLREDVIDARTLRRFACACAWRALVRERAAGREPDPRSWRAVEVARRYADRRATSEELRAAWSAAGAAWAANAAEAANAAANAAGDAAWAAHDADDAAVYAAYAADDAAVYAAYAADDAAVWAARAAWAAEAAGDAAWAAEREWQIDVLRRLLRGEEESNGFGMD